MTQEKNKLDQVLSEIVSLKSELTEKRFCLEKQEYSLSFKVNNHEKQEIILAKECIEYKDLLESATLSYQKFNIFSKSLFRQKATLVIANKYGKAFINLSIGKKSFLINEASCLCWVNATHNNRFFINFQGKTQEFVCSDAEKIVEYFNLVNQKISEN